MKRLQHEQSYSRCRVIEPAGPADIKRILEKINVHSWAVEYLSKKTNFSYVLLEHIDNRAANILKQELISLGSDAGISQDVSRFKQGKTSVLLHLSDIDLARLKSKLINQPFGLKNLTAEIEHCLQRHSSKTFSLGDKKYNTAKRIVLFGILNVTPDSFSDGGKYSDKNAAIRHGIQLASDGADYIDIGGESTRPGAKTVSADEELARVLPVVKALSKEHHLSVSIDTRKASVAEPCLKTGAAVLNDISALRFDKKMVKVAKEYDVPVILMHMKGSPGTMQNNPGYADCIREIYSFFEERIEYALANGIRERNIILDPGIGFGKRLEDNLEILKRLAEFRSLGFPIFIGSSRKAFIAKIYKAEAAPEQRLEGTIASCLWAASHGASCLRVHEPLAVRRALAVYQAIQNQEIG